MNARAPITARRHRIPGQTAGGVRFNKIDRPVRLLKAGEQFCSCKADPVRIHDGLAPLVKHLNRAGK